MFSDEENTYNIDEVKYKLKVDSDEVDNEDNVSLDGLENLDDVDIDNLEDDKSKKPFDDEPFDAGVEADEETEPKKFIEQLTGKLAQTLRSYTKEEGKPDFELEKFVVNSIIAATHTGEMEPDDQKDIIKKVKTAGKGEGDIDVNVDIDVDTDADNENVDVDDGNDKDSGDEKTTEENFNLGEGKTPIDSLFKSIKKPNFVKDNEIINKLRENFMTEVEPKTLPKIKPKIKPSRKRKIWRPNKMPKINPKAEK